MPERQNQTKRRRILDAALHVFSERGFHHATVSEVARTARVGKGTVYLYFGGKEALLVSLFEQLAERIIWIFDQITAERGSLQNVVDRLVAEQLDHGRTRSQIFQLMAQQPFLTNLSLQREKRTLVQRIVDRVAARIRAAIDQEIIRPCDETLCACVLLALPGAIPLYRATSSDATLPEQMPWIAHELSQLLWNGLHKEGA